MRKGTKHSEESKQKSRLAHIGKKLSEEHRKKVSLANMGRIVSKETRKKIGDAQRGEKNHHYGKPISDEQKKRMSEANIGRNKGLTYEQIYGEERAKEIKQKIGAIHKGRKGYWNGKKFSDEHRMKISEDRKGKTYEERHGKELADQLKELRREAVQERIGEKNPRWLGGKSFEPYGLDFNKKFKETIKERDHYACLLCNIFDEDAKKLYKKALAVHHIDYDKKNTFPQNCCSLCNRCNILINKDREIWTKHFHELLRKLYNYEYTQDQKIILDFIGEK